MQLVKSFSSLKEIDNRLLKNTSILLVLMMLVGAIVAYVNMSLNIVIHPLLALVVLIGLSYLVDVNSKSQVGVYLSFLLSAVVGLLVGPVLSVYLGMENGSSIVFNAFIGTALVFAGTGLYAFNRRPTVSGLVFRSMFFIMLSVIVVSLINFMFLQLSILSVFISAIVLILSSFYLTLTMSAVFNESPYINYISAANSIFISLFNVFMSLLSLFGYDK